MPRSNPSGGPWGSGPQGTPDLEEFLRRSHDRLRGFMPGNLGDRRRQIQAALLYGQVEAAAGVHPAKARRIAVNIAKLPELAHEQSRPDH